ncbi:uncharacterized protein VTP21DRAFT_1772 [Calcarisporiella thermophila]|uniref:uncharacterized protein n=1 Tax=Calcarisporiella thermophila TaxID=911321 RepID=UPI0037445D3B
MWRHITRRRTLYATLLTTTAATSYFVYSEVERGKRRYATLTSPLDHSSLLLREAQAEAVQLENRPNKPHAFWTPPSREEMISKLKSSQEKPFDMLIIGGGATGAGVALDAATRGLNVALVERDDFASGTSSRSTKLVHGGVRYLEKAVKELDYEQYKLVKEALYERSTFLHTAPYLSYQLPIMLPVYKWWQVPYYWAGCKAYDILAGREGLESSYFLPRGKALEAFPMLKKEKLVGALVYYDGQHNDARMNVALALTAISHNAVVTNHVEVTELIKEKDESGLLVTRGAKVRDTLTGEEWTVRAKGVINATGPFTDAIRKMDDVKAQDIVAPSAGVHIILPNYYSPGNMGLIDPSTSDGRVIFFLPWQGNTIAGTTDSPTEVTPNPLPKEEEITWILDEVRRYLSPDVKVRRGDVLAAWSGIRPLVRDPAAENTAALVRNHMINVSEDKLITIAGGKWTTYRAMAADTVDKAIEVFGLEPTSECRTHDIKLVGSHGYSKTMFIRLIQQFGLETEVAQHLSNSYGDRAWGVAALAKATGHRWPVFGIRITPLYPYIEAEIRFAVRREYACTAVDVLARRTRLAFLNAQASLEALPRVIEIMAEELGWDEARREKEYQQTVEFLYAMGLPNDPKARIIYPITEEQTPTGKPIEADTAYGQRLLSALGKPSQMIYSRARFSAEELSALSRAFAESDVDGDGHIPLTDLPKILTRVGVQLERGDLDAILTEAEFNYGDNGEVEFDEFLEVMSSVHERLLAQPNSKPEVVKQTSKISTDRSGGGI